jgi:sulfatase modifying factor 1
MHVNVWEWCQDWEGPYGSERVLVDPTGPTQGSRRVLRGGSCFFLPKNVRSAVRGFNHPGNRTNLNGFRLARTYDLSP